MPASDGSSNGVKAAPEDETRQGDGKSKGLPGRPTPARRPAPQPTSHTASAQEKRKIFINVHANLAETQYYGTDGANFDGTCLPRPGAGEVKINRKSFEQYFPNETLRMIIPPPSIDRDCQQVRHSGQRRWAAARRAPRPGKQQSAHGITRALIEVNTDVLPTLKHAGLVTRDPRSRSARSRHKGARKRFQFSKRCNQQTVSVSVSSF